MSNWYSDVQISSPTPHTSRPLVSMSGFVFTDNGLAHDLTEEEHRAIFTPKGLPQDPTKVAYDDQHLDNKPSTEYL